MWSQKAPLPWLSASHLAAKRSLRSWKPTAGRATREVSSRNTLVGLKGIAYRKVGIRLLASRISGLPYSSKAASDFLHDLAVWVLMPHW